MKEIPLYLILKTVTLKRIINAGKAISSFLLSAITKRSVVWGKPFILTVEPTNICNLKCPLCVTGNSKMLRKAGMMDFQTYKKILDEFADSIFYLLLYQQGEPFINKDFIRFIEYAKRKNIFVTTSTNAHYFDEETAAATVRSGLDTIIVSIDGLDQKSYEKYRVNGGLKTVTEGIKSLVLERKKHKNKTPKIYLQFIVMQHNEAQLSQLNSFAESLGIDKVLLKTVQVENKKEAEEWLPLNPDYRRYEINGGEIRTKTVGKGPCPRPWTSTLVNWDGSVVPCCFDKHGVHIKGSFKETNNIDEIWQSESYGTFRHGILKNRKEIDICSNCSQGLKLYI